jgi:5-hydroxyisourate hydrolase
MGLSTHVLDTMHGKPAAGMGVALLKKQGEAYHLLKTIVLNQDGRADSPLIETHDLQMGQYRLSFSAGEYFRSKLKDLAEPLFLDVVHLDFGVSNTKEHYHVPLLVSPWSYSTYRGS